MTNLKPDKILQRIQGLNINIDSIQTVRISLDGKEATCSNHCLLILEAFAQPCSIRNALQKVSLTGAYDWINLTGVITQLYHFGALRDPAELEFIPSPELWNFGSSPAHISMLNDKIRTERFIKAIQETVTEGDIVIEIGTGTGVLAIAAARAGAAKVYTIEAGAMAPTAQKIINSTEVAGKIEIIRGWSPNVELPEKGDVLIGEIIGNDPFAESILMAFRDARQRLLKPEAKIIPNRVRAFGLPVEIPTDTLRNRVLTEVHLEDWKNWYEIDFSALDNNVPYQNTPLLNLKSLKAKELKTLGDSVLLADIDLHTFQEATVQNTVNLTMKQSGSFNGLLMYFELELGTQMITTNPDVTESDSSWLNPVWYLGETKSVKENDTFTIKYYFNAKSSEFSFIE